MTSTENACPFCNAVLPALSAPPVVAKVPCPRCGELVPAARWQVSAAIAAGLPPAPPRPAAPGLPGNRKTALLIVGIMVAMAVIGLSYALWTVKLRQSRHPRPALDPIVLTHPLALTAIGHLPKESDIVVGLHIATLLADTDVGKPLLDEPLPSALNWVVKQLPKMTGLKLDEIDHAVLSTAFDGQFPQAHLVIKTRRVIDLAKIAEHAKAADPPVHEDRPLYALSFQPTGEALFWCVDAKTILCVIRFDPPRTEHLRGFSITAKKADEVLIPSLHDAMDKRLTKGTLAWTVGRLDRLGALAELMPIAPAAKKNLQAVKDVKTFAIGITPVKDVTMLGHFQLPDAKSTALFKSVLDGLHIDGAKSQKVETPPADEKEQWLTWQLRADVPTLRVWLNFGKELRK